MIRQTIPATLFVGGITPNIVIWLSKTVSQEDQLNTQLTENPWKWSKRLRMKLPAVVWLAMVYYNATITFNGPQTSPTTIFTSLTVAILASFRHLHFYRQSGMCSGIIYPFYTHITVRACTYMFMLEFQLVIPYHNRHTHCPRLSPYVMSDLEMLYIQHGTVKKLVW